MRGKADKRLTGEPVKKEMRSIQNTQLDSFTRGTYKSFSQKETENSEKEEALLCNPVFRLPKRRVAGSRDDQRI